MATVLLLLPLLIGLVGTPTAPHAQGDELEDAQARQAELQKEADKQKEQIAQLEQLQLVMSEDIKQTTGELNGINADLAAVRLKITDDGGPDRGRRGAVRRARRAARRS